MGEGGGVAELWIINTNAGGKCREGVKGNDGQEKEGKPGASLEL